MYVPPHLFRTQLLALKNYFNRDGTYAHLFIQLAVLHYFTPYSTVVFRFQKTSIYALPFFSHFGWTLSVWNSSQERQLYSKCCSNTEKNIISPNFHAIVIGGEVKAVFFLFFFLNLLWYPPKKLKFSTLIQSVNNKAIAWVNSRGRYNWFERNSMAHHSNISQT